MNPEKKQILQGCAVLIAFTIVFFAAGVFVGKWIFGC